MRAHSSVLVVLMQRCGISKIPLEKVHKSSKSLGMAATVGILEYTEWNVVRMAHEEWHNSYRACSRVAAIDGKRGQ